MRSLKERVLRVLHSLRKQDADEFQRQLQAEAERMVEQAEHVRDCQREDR